MASDITFNLSKTENSWLCVGLKYFPGGIPRVFLGSYIKSGNFWCLQNLFPLSENDLHSLKGNIDDIIEAAERYKYTPRLQRQFGVPGRPYDVVDHNETWAAQQQYLDGLD